MRVIVFFDLPVDTKEGIRAYNRFRKFLIKNGFLMMQESVYSKIVLNQTAAEATKANIRRNSTKKGLIQMLTITEKQFSDIELIVGEIKKDVISSDERLVII